MRINKNKSMFRIAFFLLYEQRSILNPRPILEAQSAT
jgi:hypothetical protein